jgi:hypothetical protein
MNSLINIGFGNFINTSMVLSVVRADSAPVKRLVQAGKDSGKAVDATQGRKTKAVIIMRDDTIVLSALMPDTIAARLNEHSSAAEKTSMDD